ncbi:TPA: DUF11 domain-containing protein [Candidatus Woesearchaeota archaeon]|nr:DUF11 domain-containing protein [Candidatus Woesearchaeota archaeon]
MSHLGSTPSGLGSLVIASPGPFTGLTVNQFLEIAEKVLGGLSSDFTPSEVNHQADLINNAQDAGSLTGDCVPCNPEVFQCGPTVVLKPKLEITKVASLTHVSIGQEIIYTITVTNTGNAPALDVVLIDTEDPQLAFVSANPAPMIVSGNINTGYALTWNVGTILPGEFKVFSVTKKLGLLAVHNSVLHDFVTATSINADPVQASAAVTVENAPPVGPPRTPGYWKQQTCGTKAAKFSQIQIQQFLNLISVSTIVPQLQSLTPSQACALLSTLDNANPLEKLLKFLLNNWLNLAANFIEPNSYYSFSSPDFSGFDSTIKKKSENDILNNAQADVLLYDKDVLDEIANSGSNSVSVVPYQTVSSSWFNPDFAIATMGILGIVVFGLFFLSRRDMAGHKK